MIWYHQQENRGNGPHDESLPNLKNLVDNEGQLNFQCGNHWKEREKKYKMKFKRKKN